MISKNLSNQLLSLNESIQERENLNLIENEGNEQQFQPNCWAIFHASWTLRTQDRSRTHSKVVAARPRGGSLGALAGGYRGIFTFYSEFLHCGFFFYNEHTYLI